MFPLFSPKEKEDLKGVEASERDEEASPQPGWELTQTGLRGGPHHPHSPRPGPNRRGATLLNAVRRAQRWNTQVGR